jgi:hypothetical protein
MKQLSNRLQFTQLAVLFTLVAVLFLMWAPSAKADQAAISTGRAGLSYHDLFGGNLASAMREQGVKLSVLESEGSIQNLDRVAAGEAQLGLTQADAFMSWRKQNPDSANDIEVLGTLDKECAFLAVKEGGPISDEDDLDKSGVKIAVGNIGSGSAATWSYLTQLEPDYAKASVFHKGGVRALSGVVTGRYDAFLWVTFRSNVNNDYMKTVMGKDSGLKLVPLNDYSLNDKLPTGDAVYAFDEVDVESGWFASTVEAPCTDILVVGHLDASEKLLDSVAHILLTNKQRILSAK